MKLQVSLFVSVIALLTSCDASIPAVLNITIQDSSLESMKEIIEKEVLHNCLPVYINNPTTPVAATCKAIAVQWPQYPSGYYWVQTPPGLAGVYCDLDGSRFGRSGGWMRVAGHGIKNFAHTSSSFCAPVDTTTDPVNNACLYVGSRGCSSKIFSAHGIRYNTVCGRVLGRQEGSTDAFHPTFSDSANLDGVYLDGVSITHGTPRKHIWSLGFATHYSSGDCPCVSNVNAVISVSPFIGKDYFCEAGRTVWDGKCSNRCCQKGGPWFCKTLPEQTADDIELRVCATGPDEKFLLEEVEIYVQ